MAPESKERISEIMNTIRIVFYYGFIPTVLILGFMKGADEGNPPLTIMRFVDVEELNFKQTSCCHEGRNLIL